MSANHGGRNRHAAHDPHHCGWVHHRAGCPSQGRWSAHPRTTVRLHQPRAPGRCAADPRNLANPPGATNAGDRNYSVDLRIAPRELDPTVAPDPGPRTGSRHPLPPSASPTRTSERLTLTSVTPSRTSSDDPIPASPWTTDGRHHLTPHAIPTTDQFRKWVASWTLPSPSRTTCRPPDASCRRWDDQRPRTTVWTQSRPWPLKVVSHLRTTTIRCPCATCPSSTRAAATHLHHEPRMPRRCWTARNHLTHPATRPTRWQSCEGSPHRIACRSLTIPLDRDSLPRSGPPQFPLHRSARAHVIDLHVRPRPDDVLCPVRSTGFGSPMTKGC